MHLKFIIITLSILQTISSDKLEQVLILSRHNVRTPLSKVLTQTSPKRWPDWNEKSGYLTAKGILLEGFMGEFFSAWLYKKGLLPDICPNEDELFVYANMKQRTIASAWAFLNKGFPNCNIVIHHSGSKTDPNFNPVIHNNTVVFKKIALNEMQERLESLKNLNGSYQELENILDFKESTICKINGKCELTAEKNKIINVETGEKPNILGPLKIGNSVIDAFIMEYYEGFPMENVAWGQLSSMKQWEKIMAVSRGYHNVIFNTTIVAKDIAEPLIKYIANIFLNDNAVPKTTLLMGHDANVYTVLNGMRFKPYVLPNQYEMTPVGGKIVFQKWLDEKNNRYLLKIKYVYQSTIQLRDGIKLSLKNPPESFVLELEDCEVDSRGFCSWEDFKKLLNSLL